MDSQPVGAQLASDNTKCEMGMLPTFSVRFSTWVKSTVYGWHESVCLSVFLMQDAEAGATLKPKCDLAHLGDTRKFIHPQGCPRTRSDDG
jgi:hypothetical protein